MELNLPEIEAKKILSDYSGANNYILNLKSYYERNRDYLKAYMKVYYYENKNLILEKQRRYRNKNQNKIKEYHRERYLNKNNCNKPIQIVNKKYTITFD